MSFTYAAMIEDCCLFVCPLDKHVNRWMDRRKWNKMEKKLLKYVIDGMSQGFTWHISEEFLFKQTITHTAIQVLLIIELEGLKKLDRFR